MLKNLEGTIIEQYEVKELLTDSYIIHHSRHGFANLKPIKSKIDRQIESTDLI